MKKQRDTRFEKEVDEWLKNGHSPDDVKTLLQQITKAVVERALQGELAAHLGYAKHEPEGIHSGNSRNGATTKTVRGDFGEVELERRGTGTASLSHASCASTRRGSTGGTRKSCRCTREE